MVVQNEENHWYVKFSDSDRDPAAGFISRPHPRIPFPAKRTSRGVSQYAPT